MTETVLDARGLKCPLPVLKTEKAIGALAAGTRLVVLASDPMARIDIPHYCTQNGHACTVDAAGEALRFSIVKAGC